MSDSGPSTPPRVLDPAPPAAPAGGSTLSPELAVSAARRLGALALVVGCSGLVLTVLMPLGGLRSVLGSPVRLLLMLADDLSSLALAAAIAWRWLGARRALRLGLLYQLTHALLASVVFYSVVQEPGTTVRGWTPAAVWALVFPLVVPSRPRRVVVGTLLTVATDPLALWISVTAGAHRPSTADLAEMLFPTAMVCIVAPIAARIVYGLTQEVKRAKEMGSYRLVEKLGEGGMGEVWRAEHRLLARAAAIKLIRPSALGAGGSHAREMLKRFEREARATAALRSPHTIEVYDYGVSADGTFHYVMELLEGYSLQALVDRFGPVPPARAVHLLIQACHSLAEAHAAGLVHRDVKPANIFVGRLGLDVDFVKVLDFGLVKRHGVPEGAEALTGEGSFTGTPAFMPPEVALGTEPIDGRADIYALGCVAFWLLTGQRVFESGSAMQMVIDHVRTPPDPPSRRAVQTIPEALDALVLRCLEKDPGARPESVEVLRSALRGLGLAQDWTEERARAWWAQEGAAGGAGLPDLDLDTSLPTRSRVKPPAIA